MTAFGLCWRAVVLLLFFDSLVGTVYAVGEAAASAAADAGNLGEHFLRDDLAMQFVFSN